MKTGLLGIFLALYSCCAFAQGTSNTKAPKQLQESISLLDVNRTILKKNVVFFNTTTPATANKKYIVYPAKVLDYPYRKLKTTKTELQQLSKNQYFIPFGIFGVSQKRTN